MALPEFNLRQLLEAGVHYGHQTQRWNPRMAEFIYGDRNGIHILDLTQTLPMLDAALQVVRDTVAKGGRVLAVTALGPTLAQARARAYRGVDQIDFADGFHRRDIGWRELERSGA